MLWINCLLASALLLGLVLSAEEDKKGGGEDRGEAPPNGEQSLTEEKQGAVYGGGVPVPLPLPARPAHVIIPNPPQLPIPQAQQSHSPFPPQPVYQQQAYHHHHQQQQHQQQSHKPKQDMPFGTPSRPHLHHGNDQQASPQQQHIHYQPAPPHVQQQHQQQIHHQQQQQQQQQQHHLQQHPSEHYTSQQDQQLIQHHHQQHSSADQGPPDQQEVPSLAIQDVHAGSLGGGGGGGGYLGSAVQGGPATGANDLGGLGSEGFPGFPSLPADPWPLPQPEMPKIVHLDVKCEKNLMKIAVEFDKPFNGVIFSKGHYGSCVHLPAGSGRTTVYFDISISSCGTSGNTQNGLYGPGSGTTGTFFENTIVVQYDPQVQEVWDQARKLRCTWHDQYEKAVTFRPFPVDMLDVVRADFAGDNVGCWMQVQVGKGPWASEVSGIVKIGQTMTMVLAIKDDENKFDMLVRNCIAHDGHRAPIELVDSQGCVVRPKLMSRFTKIKNFGSSASVLSYAHFQAFKFPDSMEVHFQCTIQICRFQCPEQCSSAAAHQASSARHDVAPVYEAGRQQHHPNHRQERDVAATVQEVTEIGLNRVIKVVSPGDLAFNLPLANDSSSTGTSTAKSEESVVRGEAEGVICMSTPGLAASLVVLLAILVISCLVSAFLCLRYRAVHEGSPYDVPMFKIKAKH